MVCSVGYEPLYADSFGGYWRGSRRRHHTAVGNGILLLVRVVSAVCKHVTCAYFWAHGLCVSVKTNELLADGWTHCIYAHALASTITQHTFTRVHVMIKLFERKRVSI